MLRCTSLSKIHTLKRFLQPFHDITTNTIFILHGFTYVNFKLKSRIIFLVTIVYLVAAMSDGTNPSPRAIIHVKYFMNGLFGQAISFPQNCSRVLVLHLAITILKLLYSHQYSLEQINGFETGNNN